MRCLTLADTLIQTGAECIFLCCSHLGNINDLIRLRGYKVMELACGALEKPARGKGDLAHSSWLKCDQEEDATESLAIINATGCDVVVVDHYALDYRWEKRVHSSCEKIVVVDDLADRSHHCDLLLDQNWFGDEHHLRYGGLVPEGCELLLGPKYALLKPEYATLGDIMPDRDGKIRRLLIFMGGSDPCDETSKVVSSLDLPELKDVLVDVILGVNHPDPLKVLRVACRSSNIAIHRQQNTLAGWMFRADLMIGGGGTTTWERMCLGLPGVVISIADNQTETNRALQSSGYVEFLGDSARVTSNMIAGAIRNCIVNPDRIKDMSVRGMALVDGRGAMLVADKIVELCR
jgi:UDP-2,4-diacetamido-2,4,6-trideoxy-beta-L-altropyranose hydrolase